MISYRILIIAFFLTALSFFSFAQCRNVVFQISDNERCPLSNAYIIHNNTILSSTNAMGLSKMFDVAPDTLTVRYIGYEPLIILCKGLPSYDTISFMMKKTSYVIDQISVTPESPLDLLFNAQKSFNDVFSINKYVGEASFIRYASQNGKYISYEEHDGIILKTNERDFLKRRYTWCFVPQESRLSDFFEYINGVYKLMYSKYSTKNTYNANSITWNTAIIAHEKYGPQNKKMSKYYEFIVSEYTDSSIIYIFNVNRKHYPKKISIDGRGFIHLDIETKEIVRVEYEHFSYVHYIANYSRKLLLPAYQCIFAIDYNTGEKYLPKKITIERRWIQGIENSDRYMFWPKPVRIRPSETMLYECEQLFVHTLAKGKIHKIGDYSLSFVVSLMAANSYVEYDNKYWCNKTKTLFKVPDNLFYDLSFIDPVDNQFEKNSNRLLMGDDYNNYYILEEYQPLFSSLWNDSKQIFQQIKKDLDK